MGASLGIGGGIGALLGIALIVIIDPGNAGGKGLLLFVSTVFCTTIGGIIGKFTKSKSDKKNEYNKQSENKDQNIGADQSGARHGSGC